MQEHLPTQLLKKVEIVRAGLAFSQGAGDSSGYCDLGELTVASVRHCLVA